MNGREFVKKLALLHNEILKSVSAHDYEQIIGILQWDTRRGCRYYKKKIVKLLKLVHDGNIENIDDENIDDDLNCVLQIEELPSFTERRERQSVGNI